ncbi:MAG: indoleacetamide hydrolase [Lautropia sp.]
MNAIQLTVTEAAAALRAGDLTAEAYAAALLARAEQRTALNAFIALDPERVLTAARAADRARTRGEPAGPLHGVPLTLKDNLDTAGIATTGGTPGLRGHVPRRNAAVVQRLLDAGAIVFGKANLHELAYGITNNNAAFGAARNPWDPSRIPGGSSGGTGVAVAARITPGGIGTDTGGSVRIPAALCGIVGFRPTTGLWSQAGVVPISHTRDTPGPMARSVADVALLHAVVTGAAATAGAAGAAAAAAAAAGATRAAPPPSLAGVRLGVPRGHFWENLDPETARVCEAALTALRDAGAVLVEGDVADAATLDNTAGFPIALYETVTDLGAYLREHGIALDYAALVAQCASPDMAGLLQSLAKDGAIPPAAYQQALTVERPLLQRRYREHFESLRIDAVVFPTTPLPAAPIGEDDTVQLNGAAVPTFPTFIRNCSPGSVAGIPGLSLPVGLSRDGLPIGLEIDGPAQADARVLALGRALEALLPAPALPD